MPDRANSDNPTTRRTVLAAATVGAGVVALGAAGWGLLGSLTPTGDVLADGKAFDINLSEISEGAEHRVKAYGLPILVRHRTPDEIAAAEQAGPDQYPFDETLDVFGRRIGSADDLVRRATPDGKFIALVGRFQDFDCVPLEGPNGDFGGWFEPCRGTHYDSSGRMRKGVAQENLRLPVFELLQSSTLRLITNPNYVKRAEQDGLLYR